MAHMKQIFVWLRKIVDQYNFTHEYCHFTTTNRSRTRPTWNGLPDVAIRKIFGQLTTGDRARMALVSKSWKRILTRDDLPVPPELPWQYVPLFSCFNLDSYLTLVHFDSYSEGHKSYRFELPRFHGDIRGGWFCGSSNGWLVMSAGPKLNPDMFLWNPLTNSVQKLPPLATISIFPQLMKSNPETYNISSYMKRVNVFSRRECIVVAVVFSDPEGGKENYLAMCTTEDKDKKWKVLKGDYFYSFSDILFHNGKLYALAHIIKRDGEKDHRNKPCTRMHTIRLSWNCEVQVCVFCLDYKADGPDNRKQLLYNQDEVENPMFNVSYDDKMTERLAEISGHVSVIGVIFDLYTYNSNGDGPMKSFRCHEIDRIEVRKVDGLERIGAGESSIEEHVMVTDSGSIKIPADAVPGRSSSVALTLDSVGGLVWERDEKKYVARDVALFDMRDGDLISHYVQYMEHPVLYRTGWLTPKLF